MWMISLWLTLAAQEPAEQFLTEFEAKRQKVAVLEASFTQRSITPDEEEVAKGTLLYANPRRIVFRYASPAPSVCLIDGLKVHEYDVEWRQVQIFNLDDDPETEALYLGFESDLKRLSEAYDMELFDTGDAFPDTTGLLLRPKPRDDDLEPLFERVHLYLRNEDYLPIRIYIAVSAETTVDIDITDCVVNGTIKPEDTQLDLPEGVKIYEDDELIEEVGPDGKRIPEAITPAPPKSDDKPAEEPAEEPADQ